MGSPRYKNPREQNREKPNRSKRHFAAPFRTQNGAVLVSEAVPYIHHHTQMRNANQVVRNKGFFGRYRAVFGDYLRRGLRIFLVRINDGIIRTGLLDFFEILPRKIRISFHMDGTIRWICFKKFRIHCYTGPALDTGRLVDGKRGGHG